MIPPATSEELLAQMVSFDTVNPRFGGPVGGESALARYLETLALGWGLRTQHYSLGRLGSIYANYGSADSNSILSVTRYSEANFNLLVTCEADPGGEWLLFESYLDTVGIEGMTIEPFAGRVERELLRAGCRKLFDGSPRWRKPATLKCTSCRFSGPMFDAEVNVDFIPALDRLALPSA